MNELEQVRTPALIGAEIRMYVDAGRRVTLLCGIEIGRRLNEAKELLKHGEWLPWLEKETKFSERQAQRYMKVFNEYGAAQLGLFGPETNATTLSDLPISKALALLSVPESEREQFAKDVNAEALSTRELGQAIREKQEAEQRALDAEKALHELEESEGLAIAELQEKLEKAKSAWRMAKKEAERAAEGVGLYRERAEAAELETKKLREEIKELESRPQPVAVQRDEKAIEEAAEKLGELQKKLEKAEKEKEKIKKKADEETRKRADDIRHYEEKLAAAETAVERAQEELEKMRKQLAASNKDVTAFGIYFKAVQEDVNRMMEKLREIDERDSETAGKLRVAARTILAKTLERIGAE